MCVCVCVCVCTALYIPWGAACVHYHSQDTPWLQSHRLCPSRCPSQSPSSVRQPLICAPSLTFTGQKCYINGIIQYLLGSAFSTWRKTLQILLMWAFKILTVKLQEERKAAQHPSCLKRNPVPPQSVGCCVWADHRLGLPLGGWARSRRPVSLGKGGLARSQHSLPPPPSPVMLGNFLSQSDHSFRKLHVGVVCKTLKL